MRDYVTYVITPGASLSVCSVYTYTCTSICHTETRTHTHIYVCVRGTGLFGRIYVFVCTGVCARVSSELYNQIDKAFLHLYVTSEGNAVYTVTMTTRMQRNKWSCSSCCYCKCLMCRHIVSQRNVTLTRCRYALLLYGFALLF